MLEAAFVLWDVSFSRLDDVHLQVKRGSGHCLGYHSGVAHLRKALHIYPNSNLIR